MSERFLNKVKLVSSSLLWYLTDPKNQYHNSRLELYDQAAAQLTRRRDFAKFLVNQIGAIRGKTLEIAAGSGLVSSILQERLNNVVFLDLSSQALKLLKQKTFNSNNVPQIVNSNFFYDPFPSECFDQIVCVGGYRYIDEEHKSRFWNETVRILKNDGRLFFAQFKPRWFPVSGSLLEDKGNKFGIEIISSSQYRPKIDVGPIKVTTGCYELVEYRKIQK